MLIRDCVHSGWCPFGIVSIRDCVHSGLCPFGIVSIRDCVHSGWCPFGIVSFRDCVHSRWCPFGIVFIRDCVHSGWCPFGIVCIRDGVHSRLCPFGIVFFGIVYRIRNNNVLDWECAEYDCRCSRMSWLSEFFRKELYSRTSTNERLQIRNFQLTKRLFVEIMFRITKECSSYETPKIKILIYCTVLRQK